MRISIQMIIKNFVNLNSPVLFYKEEKQSKDIAIMASTSQTRFYLNGFIERKK